MQQGLCFRASKRTPNHRINSLVRKPMFFWGCFTLAFKIKKKATKNKCNWLTLFIADGGLF
jgi:hypothetical protein